MPLDRRRFLAGAAVGLTQVGAAAAPPDKAPELIRQDYMLARRSFHTHLLRRGPAPDQPQPLTAPPGARPLRYTSGSLELVAWLSENAASAKPRPAVLFLDEPTSGADPLARRAFWRRITALAEQGVTIIVTTHFMQEAEYCDRIAIMDAGRVLAEGPPGEIRHRADTQVGDEPSMEDAFIAIVEKARRNGLASEKAA